MTEAEREKKEYLTLVKNLEDSPELLAQVLDYELEKEDSVYGFERLITEGWNFKHNVIKSYPCPWRSLKDKFFFVHGEATILSGYTGHGKSEVAMNIMLYAIAKGAKAYLVSSELSVGEIYDRIAVYATGVKDHTKEYYQKIAEHYAGKLWVLNATGVLNIENEIERAFKLKVRYGCDFFVFDNLMQFNSKIDDFNSQCDVVRKIVDFAKDNQVCCLLVAHSKKPPNVNLYTNKKYYEPPGIYDILGTSSIANLIQNHFSVTINYQKRDAVSKKIRNKTLTKSEEEALTTGDVILFRDKKRHYGENFIRGLHYDKKFLRLKDYENEKLEPYVHYSKLNP